MFNGLSLKSLRKKQGKNVSPLVTYCANPGVILNNVTFCRDVRIHLLCPELWKKETHHLFDRQETPQFSSPSQFWYSDRISWRGSLPSASGTRVYVDDRKESSFLATAIQKIRAKKAFDMYSTLINILSLTAELCYD